MTDTPASAVSTPARTGEIITFYSYKGGTGRSMALANVGWILASAGKRVLLIDWDLEAPGLHRYLHPFLEDKELTRSPGLIDYFVEFSQAARLARRTTSDSSDTERKPWHAPFHSLLRFSYSLEWDFGDGTLDLVPAGQQGPGYAQRVHSFDWHDFFRNLGGGVLLEGLKAELRREYDYVLIDSRTGLSDTSGICTVQMPDQLVVCFTLNRQSVQGAAAVAASADEQRRRPTGEPSLRIWPLVTRVEQAEKERRDAARAIARASFQPYLRQLPREHRADYWGETEVLYQPYFAYEEVLAVFAEARRQPASMLASLEALTRHLSGNTVSQLHNMTSAMREDGQKAFQQVTPARQVDVPIEGEGTHGQIFIAYPAEDRAIAERLVRSLKESLRNIRSTAQIWFDLDDIMPGQDWVRALDEAVARSEVTLAVFGPGWLKRENVSYFEAQVATGLQPDKHIVPLLFDGVTTGTWVRFCAERGMKELTRRHALTLESKGSEEEIARLAQSLDRLLSSREVKRPRVAPVDPDDPHKGQWGGRAANEQRRLSATVTPLSANWFELAVQLERTGGAALEGEVEFHLHPSFVPAVLKVQAVNGRASADLRSWGAFTIGVRADEGATRLELDLSELHDAPKRFREH